MGIPMQLVLFGFLLISAGSAFKLFDTEPSNGFTDQLERGVGGFGKFVGDLISGACATLVGGMTTGPCAVTYYNTMGRVMKNYRGTDGDNEIDARISYFKFCCARAALRACIVESIQEVCGDKAESQSDLALKKIFRTVAEQNSDSCSGTEIIYQDGSPLCWDEPAQYALVAFLVLLFLCCCCCACVKRCCSLDR